MSGLSRALRLDRERQNPQDPHVWCGCYRDKVLLSEKLRGVACSECRRDAGEEVLTPEQRHAMEDALRRLIFERSRLTDKANDLALEIAAVDMRLSDIEMEVEPLERALGRDS